jgi:hypothetical protein
MLMETKKIKQTAGVDGHVQEEKDKRIRASLTMSSIFRFYNLI